MVKLNSSDPITSDSAPHGRRRRWWIAGAAVIAAVIAAAIWLSAPTGSTRRLDQARLMFVRGRHDEALNLADDLLVAEPTHTQALMLAAEIEMSRARYDNALDYLNRVDGGTDDAITARLMSARIYHDKLHRLTPAEDQLRHLLALRPDHQEAIEGLVIILGLETRQFEAAPWRLRRLAHSVGAAAADTLQLYSLALGDTALENPELIANMHAKSPDDPGIQLAMARLRFEQRQFAAAADLARRAAQRMSLPGEAFAVWGRSIVELNDAEQWTSWKAALGQDALNHPGVWYARGAWATSHNQHEVAVRCYWETVKRNPAHQKANYQLGQALLATGRSSDAQPFFDRALHLESLLRVSESAHHAGGADDALNAAFVAERIGLLWEARFWSVVALERAPKSVPAQELSQRLEPRINDLPFERCAPGHNPAGRVDFSSLPDEVQTHTNKVAANVADSETPLDMPDTELAAAISFADIAADIGLQFEYLNAGDPKNKGLVKMYEVVGGGVGVLDYDGDSQPDLWFLQGAATFPSPENQREHLDQLFRLQADGRVRNVTTQAHMVEPGFSQGVGIGDVNGDGFPDAYVANIGGNRLFINNGDGTFSEETPANIRGDRYTSSALIADLNGDSWPDIYELNYLAGENLFTEVCGDSTGYVGSCHPQLFDGSPDQLYLNLGNGEFENVSSEAGIETQIGKGLGIVAFRNSPDSMLQVLVANDVGPNFLLVNENASGERPRFVDHGLLSGLALNRNGKYESAMGIAAGDYDNNGFCDFFITNFDNETNTLYRQRERGFFDDATIESKIFHKREPYVGWGAQFIDADLDGWQDLIFTNGHVNDLSRQNRPFRMPAQFLRNLGDGTFGEIPSSRLGDYFKHAVLGRGLARWDWNSDGREDVIVTHLDAPAAVLQNTTESRGRYVSLELRGVESPRDAIGAIVQVQYGERVFTKQLTAGDGNQVSNQRELVFGLGLGSTVADDPSSDTIDSLTIHWPSGKMQQFERVSANTSWIVVEGLSELVPAPAATHFVSRRS